MGKRIKCRGLILNHLPAEIVDEILYKLPVKSLLRFKCVSKSWRCSISSKGFMREHLNQSNTDTDFSHHNLIFTFQKTPQIRGRWDRIGSCCIGSLLDEYDYDYDDEEATRSIGCSLSISIPALEYNNPMNRNNLVSFVGSCNGLILVSINRKELYLWNPSTRKGRNIMPNASFRQETTTWKISWHRLLYGFGYDASMDDYKIVCNFYCSPYQEEQMFMYSSRTGSWTKIPNFIKGSLPIANCAATFVNGRLHWLVNKDLKSWYIVSFDLVVEAKYQILPLPDCISDYLVCPYLEDLGGYLSFIYYNHKTRIMDVWVMEKESWSKIWAFSNQTDHVPRPIWLKNNGDIVVALGSDLVIYREKNQLRQSPVYMLDSKSRFSRVYVESLVSPFVDEQLR